MKRLLLLIAVLLLAAFRDGAEATYIPLDLSNYVTLNSSFTNEFGRQPGGTQLGVPFSIPNADADFFAFNNNTPDRFSMGTSIQRASTAYLLLNTNWGQNNFLTGEVIFTTASNRSFVLNLVGGVNIRDWNQAGYTNTVSDPNNRPTGFTAYPDSQGSYGRIDMLTVHLPEYFYGDVLQSISFLDFGSDGSSTEYIGNPSRIRVEGVTIATVPEPSTVVLLVLGLGLIVFASRRHSRRGEQIP